MLKRILTLLMAFVMVFQPMLAGATDLNAAFSNLLGGGSVLSVNKPGNYQSGARNSFVAGGLEMRVPRTSSMPQLFSVTPPRVTAGCGGISAHFGGFSFISGAEFKQMLQSIASGAALGFVSMLTLKTLCPQCEAVVQFLKTAAQQASRLAKDSCKWGQDLAKSFMSGETSTSNTQEVCGSTLSTNGTSSDYLGLMNSLDGACKSMTSAMDALLRENPDAKNDPQAKEQLKCAVGAGNVTWQRLSSFDVSGTTGTGGALGEDGYRRKLLLMNMLGADLVLNGSEEVFCETESGKVSPTEDSKEKFCTPRLKAADVVGMFMCGSPDGSGNPPGTNSPRVREYCAAFFENKDGGTGTGGSLGRLMAQKVYQCKDGHKVDCDQIELTDSGAIIQGSGFLTQINNLLRKGVDAVRTDKEMPEDVIRLMQVAPYPLYQAINAAAVYPSAADDLVDAMSLLVAEQTTVAFLDDALRLEGRTSGSQKGCLSSKQAGTILEAVAAMRAANRSRLALIGQNIAMQEALSEQIRSINLTIQKQVMTQDMLASNNYAGAVGKALTPTVNKGPEGSAGPVTP